MMPLGLRWGLQTSNDAEELVGNFTSHQLSSAASLISAQRFKGEIKNFNRFLKVKGNKTCELYDEERAEQY